MSTPKPKGAEGEDLTRARAFTSQVDTRFTYAKTVPEHPHEYLVRSWLAPELRAEFDRLCQLIAEHGYSGVFCHQTWVYLDVDQWRQFGSQSHGSARAARS